MPRKCCQLTIHTLGKRGGRVWTMILFFCRRSGNARVIAQSTISRLWQLEKTTPSMQRVLYAHDHRQKRTTLTRDRRTSRQSLTATCAYPIAVACVVGFIVPGNLATKWNVCCRVVARSTGCKPQTRSNPNASLGAVPACPPLSTPAPANSRIPSKRERYPFFLPAPSQTRQPPSFLSLIFFLWLLLLFVGGCLHSSRFLPPPPAFCAYHVCLPCSPAPIPTPALNWVTNSSPPFDLQVELHDCPARPKRLLGCLRANIRAQCPPQHL
jgi:hypothetical protein